MNVFGTLCTDRASGYEKRDGYGMEGMIVSVW
jgi:hypothetical protein